MTVSDSSDKLERPARVWALVVTTLVILLAVFTLMVLATTGTLETWLESLTAQVSTTFGVFLGL